MSNGLTTGWSADVPEYGGIDHLDTLDDLYSDDATTEWSTYAPTSATTGMSWSDTAMTEGGFDFSDPYSHEVVKLLRIMDLKAHVHSPPTLSPSVNARGNK